MQPAARPSVAGRAVRIITTPKPFSSRSSQGGKNAANAMRRLINLKDEAHYGFYYMAAQDLKSAFTQAERLIRFARGVLARE